MPRPFIFNEPQNHLPKGGGCMIVLVLGVLTGVLATII